MWFWRVLETGWIFDVFWDFTLGPQGPEHMEVEGKKPIRAAQQPTQSRQTTSFGLVFKTASSRLQPYKQLPARLNDTRLLMQDCNGPSQPGGP